VGDVSGLRVVVSGSIAQYPLGGMTWHHIQYVLGLARIGHDVYYVEDTGAGPYDPRARAIVTDCRRNVAYLADVMSHFGLADRWGYRDLDGHWAGLRDASRRRVLRSADLLLNVSGMLSRPEAYEDIPCRAYVDTDPVFNQLKLAEGDAAFRRLVDAHDVHFTFGERLATEPVGSGYRWRATRQPVVLGEWRGGSPRHGVFSTVMNWRARKKTRVHAGEAYGEKDAELLRFLELPRRVAPAVLELALNRGKNADAPVELLGRKGWRVLDPEQACAGLDGYRAYVQSSMAEWSVAKGGYVRGRPGWFSERSACYLAAGRPVVVEDTGFAPVLPVGEGIVPFASMEEAVAAVHDVMARYRRHSDTACAIAAEYFDSDRVLGALIEAAMERRRPDPGRRVGADVRADAEAAARGSAARTPMTRARSTTCPGDQDTRGPGS
jgi:hypothetical protein